MMVEVDKNPEAQRLVKNKLQLLGKFWFFTKLTVSTFLEGYNILKRGKGNEEKPPLHFQTYMPSAHPGGQPLEIQAHLNSLQ